MKELIDRAKVLKYLTPRIKTETPYGEGYNKALEDSAALVTLMPTIEAEPARHGRWIFGSSKTSCWMTCSICCKSQSGQTATFSYCPNCGARMDGGADNG